MSIPDLKLLYFTIPGRGELSRLLFTYAGIKFVDEHVTKFSELKPYCPLGQLPVLDVDGQRFCQSASLQRYAAKLGGLYPLDDPLLALHVDMISESLTELYDIYLGIRYREKDAAVQRSKFDAFGAETVTKVFELLERSVKGTFFAGDHASYADVHLFDVVHNGLSVSMSDLSLAAYPKLLSIVASVKANPHVAAYLASK